MTYEQNKKGPTLKLAHRSKHFSSVHCPFIFVGLVDKDTMEDLEAMKKNVVDDIKTAIEKKNEILKSLGDSAEKNQQQVKTDSFVRPQDDEDEEFWRVLSSRALSLSRSLARTRARAVSLSGRDADFVVCLLRTL